MLRLSPAGLLALQQGVGNRAVRSMLRSGVASRRPAAYRRGAARPRAAAADPACTAALRAAVLARQSDVDAAADEAGGSGTMPPELIGLGDGSVASNQVDVSFPRDSDVDLPAGFPSTLTFSPGTMHDHLPTGNWAEVQSHPNSSAPLNVLCVANTPIAVIAVTIKAEFGDKPKGKDHLAHYLARLGATYNEDINLWSLLYHDDHIRWKVAQKLPASPPASQWFATHLRIEQDDYQDDVISRDLLYSFGAIDRLDVLVDYKNLDLYAWFQDRYEWHPCNAMYKPTPTDECRPTNCLHAALVEMKPGGAQRGFAAADFWMKGQANLNLLLFTGLKGQPEPSTHRGPDQGVSESTAEPSG